MPPLPFSLVPFPGEAPPAALAVTGAVERRGGTLSFRTAFSGGLSSLAVDPPGERAERRDRLWEGTCAELFLREAGAPGYVEINLSPGGHWNAYRFDGYREGMRPDPAVAVLPFAAERRQDALLLSLDLPLAPLFPAGADLLAAVSAVVRTRDGARTHWALAHPVPRPDFHHADAFLLRLPPRP